MKDKRLDTPNVDQDGPQSFWRRWARRKSQNAGHAVEDPELNTSEDPHPDSPESDASKPPLKTDADMPAIETLTEQSDVIDFLSEGVSEELRRLALRKLFHMPNFNLRDGLDDYDEDYRKFTSLGDIITADMRHDIQRIAMLEEDPISEDAIPNQSETGQKDTTVSLNTTVESEHVSAIESDTTSTK